MSTVTIGSTSTAPTPRPVRPARPSRPGQGSGRRVGPTLRPGRGVAAPELRRAPQLRPNGCEVTAGRPTPVVAAAPLRVRRAATSTVRLTERGIAVVLVTGVMIAVAALTVVGATAMRVTSDGYHNGSSLGSVSAGQADR